MLETLPLRITPRLWVLGSAAYPVYLYVADPEAALFEGGIGATAATVVDQIRQLPVDLAQVRSLVITHAHPDHVMAVEPLRELLPGLKVIASAKAAQTLASEKAMAFFLQMDQLLAASLPPEGRATKDPSPPRQAAALAVDQVAGDGESIAVGTSRFQVLATPGHSECSLSFYEPQEKILIISDASGYYMPQDDSWWPNYFADYGAYVASIERLAGLNAEVLCLSHNAVIRGAEEVRSYLRRALAATRQYHDAILAEAKSGKAVRQIGEELGAAIHAKIGRMPMEFFQKNCGLLVKLSLKHEGFAPAP